VPDVVSHQETSLLFATCALCPFSRRDIPVSEYHAHSQSCRRQAIPCPDCGEMVNPRNGGMERHRQEAHELQECDQCGVSVEAYKMHDHRVSQKEKLAVIHIYSNYYYIVLADVALSQAVARLPILRRRISRF